MQKCSYTLIDHNGVEHSFNNEWELDSFMYSRRKNYLKTQGNKSSILFSTDSVETAKNIIETMEIDVKKASISFEKKIVSVDGEAEETEIVYKIPDSIGVSAFIKSVGHTTTEFNKNALFKNWNINNETVQRTIETDWESIRLSGDFLHSIFDYINKNRLSSIEDICNEFKSESKLISEKDLKTIVHKLKAVHSTLIKNYKAVYTEIPVVSKRFKDENLNKIGKNSVNGRLDIICIDSNGAVHIFDLKTSPKSVGDWGITSNADIDINEYSSAKKREIARQLVAYRCILKQQGLNVASLNVIPIKCQFDYDEQTLITRGEKLDSKLYGIKALKDIEIEDFISNLGDTTIREAENDFRRYFSVAQDVDIDYYKSVTIPITKKLFKEYDRRDTRKKYTVDEFFNNKNIVTRVTNKPGYNYYFYNRFELEGKREIYCKTEEECKEQIAKYLTQLEEVIAETNYTLANELINVLGGSISEESFLDSTPFSKKLKETYLNIFSPYITYNGDSTWTLVDNESLIRMGIFIFKSSTGLIDIIQLSDQPLHTQANLKYGQSLLGSYYHDEDEGIRQDKMVKATYGNIEIMSTLLLLNDNKTLFTDYKIHTLRIHNVETEHSVELPTTTMLFNFKQLCDVANANDTEYPKITINLTDNDFSTAWDYTLNTLSGTRFGKILISKFKGDVNNKLDAIDWIRSSMMMIKDSNKIVRNSINSGQWNLQHDESKAFILLSQALMQLTGSEFVIEDDAGQYINLKQGISLGINLTTPQFAPSKAMQNLGIITQRAHTKIISNLSKIINKEMGKYIDALYKAKGRNQLLGGEFELFSNMFVKENGKIHPSFILKNENDLSLSKEEKDFIKNFFKIIDSFRYTTDTAKEEALADGSYYQVPLLKAGIIEQIVHSGAKTAIKHTWQNKLNDLNLFQEQFDSQNNALNNYVPYNPFDISPKNRIKMLEEHGIGAFEMNLEKVLISYVKSKLRQKEYERLMPEVMGIKTVLAYHHTLHGQEVEVSMKAIDDFVKLNLFDKPIMDNNLHGVYRAMSSIQALTSYTVLGLNYRSGMREILQGMWTHISRTMVEMYGKDQFDMKDIARAWTIVFKLGIRNPNFTSMFEQLNAEYQMTNAGITEIENLISRSQTGLLNFSSDDLFIFNKIPDYFHRMGILIAKMLHDGSWDAHSMQDGVMKYDFNKDARYNLLNKPGVDKSSKLYKAQLATYLTMREQFITEGFSIPEVIDNQPLAALPRAYTLQESGSIKLFADLCFGHYDKETQMLLKHMFLGSFIMQFKTFYSAKLEQWILNPDSYKAMGSYKEQFDASGIRYMRKINITDNNVVTSEIVKENELKEGDYAVPYKDWEGKYMEGIAYTLASLSKSLYKLDWEGLQHQLANPTKRANFILFFRDMIWANIMMWIIGALFMQEDDIDKTVFEESLISAWHQSYSDGPITNLISAQIGDINPPMYRTIKKCEILQET